MKHTPGPWRTFIWNEFAGEAVINHVIVITDNKDIARFSRATDEVMANARLIAAAPELLAALQELVAVVGHDHLTAEARAAITKATGE